MPETSSSPRAHPQLPFQGVRVIDLTQVMAGPVATQMMGDHGADVIKIERPSSGDLSRNVLPDDPDGPQNPVYCALNRNKRSIGLDLRTPAGRAVAERLIADADVLVSNFRPGTMDRLGLGWQHVHELNPRLIYAAASGYGPTGPYAHKGGQDMLIQALSGVMHRRPDFTRRPQISATTTADYITGMHLVQGVLMALLTRQHTGVGQRVEVSLYDSMLAAQIQEATYDQMRDANAAPLNWSAMPHTGVFATADGDLVIMGGFADHPVRTICQALQIDDLTQQPQFATPALQGANRDELHALLGDVFRRESTSTWIERLEAAGLLCAPVRSLDEALADPQTVANEILLTIERPGEKPVHTVASPLHFSDTPAQIRLAPPRLGEHTFGILTELGYSSDEISSLHDTGTAV